MTREKAQSAWEKIVDTGFSDYNHLSPDQKIWFNIEPLTTGGVIDQYINYGAAHNEDCLQALEFLGFTAIAEQMRRINRLFTDGRPPEDINERNDEWNSWCDEHVALLDEVNENFWARCAAVEDALMEHIYRTRIGVD